jgi:hypothetical protein
VDRVVPTTGVLILHHVPVTTPVLSPIFQERAEEDLGGLMRGDLHPDPRLGMPTGGALSPDEVILENAVSYALDQQLLTRGTVGILPLMPGDISDVNIVQSDGYGKFPGLFQGLDRGRRQIFQLVHGVETREVKGGIRSQLFSNPQAHLPNLFHAIVLRGNDEIDDLHVNPLRL